MVVFLDFTQLKVKYLDETYDTVVEDGISNVPIVKNLRTSISMKSYERLRYWMNHIAV